MNREGFTMDSPSSFSPRVAVLLVIAIIGFFVWAEVRARQQASDTTLLPAPTLATTGVIASRSEGASYIQLHCRAYG